VRRVSTANCSSSGLSWLNQASPSTWSSTEDHPARSDGPFCETTRRTLPPWICSLSRPLASNCSTASRLYGLIADISSGLTSQPHPTAEWVARQISEAFPWDMAPRYMIRDRDRIYGIVVTRRLRAMGIRDKPTAPASPWQNGFAERLIGSIRRECLDHVIVLGEAHLRRILKNYAAYYNGVRTHRSLQKAAPVSRPVQRSGAINSHAILGGLHHQYVRI